MNWLALFDGLLALVALQIAYKAKDLASLRLGCSLIGAAAVLGALKFSGLLPLPGLHQSLSMLGAGAGIPLLAVTVIWPQGLITTQRRFSWIFGVILAVVCVLLAIIAGLKIVPSLLALVGVIAMLGIGFVRRQWLVVGASVCMLVAQLLYVTKFSVWQFQPGDFLHVGIAAGLLLLSRWALSERRYFAAVGA